jgi:NhaP-type Na+/H+ or K+/H+ antiporter
LIFGITLANVPRTPHMARQGARLLAFHAELSFLVRSFFFVLLGIVAEFVSRKYLLPIAGILAALLLARFLATQVSRWAIRDATRWETELLFWMLPRGLVTAVLAMEIVSVRGQVFAFLPAMAFTVVLVTNLFVVAGAVRCPKAAALGAPSTETPHIVAELNPLPPDVPVPMNVSTASQGET